MEEVGKVNDLSPFSVRRSGHGAVAFFTGMNKSSSSTPTPVTAIRSVPTREGQGIAVAANFPRFTSKPSTMWRDLWSQNLLC